MFDAPLGGGGVHTWGMFASYFFRPLATEFRNLFCLAMAGLCIASPAVAGTREVTFTTIVNPAEGGTITGGGTFMFDEFDIPYLPVTVKANEGWYLKTLIFTGGASPGHNPAAYFRDVTLDQPSDFDFTTITEFVFNSVDVAANPTFQALFAPLAPVFTVVPMDSTLR